MAPPTTMPRLRVLSNWLGPRAPEAEGAPISHRDIHCAPTRWVLAFFPEVLNFSSNVPKYRSFGGWGYEYIF